MKYIASIKAPHWYIDRDMNLNIGTIVDNLPLWSKICGNIFTLTKRGSNIVTSITSKGATRIDHILSNIPILSENFIVWKLNVITEPQIIVQHADDDLVKN